MTTVTAKNWGFSHTTGSCVPHADAYRYRTDCPQCGRALSMHNGSPMQGVRVTPCMHIRDASKGVEEIVACEACGRRWVYREAWHLEPCDEAEARAWGLVRGFIREYVPGPSLADLTSEDPAVRAAARVEDARRAEHARAEREAGLAEMA